MASKQPLTAKTRSYGPEKSVWGEVAPETGVVMRNKVPSYGKAKSQQDPASRSFIHPKDEEANQTLLDDLLDSVERAEQTGDVVTAVKLRERAVWMVRDLWGPHDPRVPRAASDLVKAMTRVAAQLTEEGDTASAAALLKKGEKWTSTNEFPGDAVTRKRLRASVFNSFGSLCAQTNKLHTALHYFERAASLDAQDPSPVDPTRVASTQLSLAALLTEAEKHPAALDSLETAISTLATEDAWLEANPDVDLSQDPDNESLGLLTIAYHNAAVELEFLGRQDEAVEAYARAHHVASRHLGPVHLTTVSIERALERAESQLRPGSVVDLSEIRPISQPQKRSNSRNLDPLDSNYVRAASQTSSGDISPNLNTAPVGRRIQLEALPVPQGLPSSSQARPPVSAKPPRRSSSFKAKPSAPSSVRRRPLSSGQPVPPHGRTSPLEWTMEEADKLYSGPKKPSEPRPPSGRRPVRTSRSGTPSNRPPKAGQGWGTPRAENKVDSSEDKDTVAGDDSVLGTSVLVIGEDGEVIQTGNEKEEKAATAIQSAFRGHIARQEFETRKQIERDLRRREAEKTAFEEAERLRREEEERQRLSVEAAKIEAEKREAQEARSQAVREAASKAKVKSGEGGVAIQESGVDMDADKAEKLLRAESDALKELDINANADGLPGEADPQEAEAAARTLQAAFRGFADRQRARALANKRRSEAAVRIQSRYRGYDIRKRDGTMPAILARQASLGPTHEQLSTEAEAFSQRHAAAAAESLKRDKESMEHKLRPDQYEMAVRASLSAAMIAMQIDPRHPEQIYEMGNNQEIHAVELANTKGMPALDNLREVLAEIQMKEAGALVAEINSVRAVVPSNKLNYDVSSPTALLVVEAITAAREERANVLISRLDLLRRFKLSSKKFAELDDISEEAEEFTDGAGSSPPPRPQADLPGNVNIEDATLLVPQSSAEHSYTGGLQNSSDKKWKNHLDEVMSRAHDKAWMNNPNLFFRVKQLAYYWLNETRRGKNAVSAPKKRRRKRKPLFYKKKNA